jgi:hypothetical protein
MKSNLQKYPILNDEIKKKNQILIYNYNDFDFKYDF